MGLHLTVHLNKNSIILKYQSKEFSTVLQNT